MQQPDEAGGHPPVGQPAVATAGVESLVDPAESGARATEEFKVPGAPVVEEIFFRGALAGAFARRFGTGVAIAASAVLFGAAHLSGMGAGNIINAAIITGLGVVLAVARFRTGTLTVSIVAHAVVNTTAVLVFQLFGTS